MQLDLEGPGMLQRFFAVLVVVWCWGYQQIAAHHQNVLEPLHQDERMEFGIPTDSEILLHAKTSCHLPPLKVRARVALGCQTIQKGRECMNVDSQHVIFSTPPSR